MERVIYLFNRNIIRSCVTDMDVVVITPNLISLHPPSYNSEMENVMINLKLIKYKENCYT